MASWLRSPGGGGEPPEWSLASGRPEDQDRVRGESLSSTAGDVLSALFLCPPLGMTVDSRSCNSRVSNSLIFEALPLYTHLGFTFSCWLNLVSDHTSCSPTSAPYTRGRRSPSSFPLNCSSVSLYLERLS